jgi:hypothetical protein
MADVTSSIEPLLERLLAGEPPSRADRDALLQSRDLLALGMAADEARRRRHGNRVTFVRVAHVSLDDAVAGRVAWEGSPGELRLSGTPADVDQAVAAVGSVVAAAGDLPVTAFSLDDLARLPGDLSSSLTALQGAGLAAVAEAPIDLLEDPRAAVDAVRAAGLPILRLTVDRASADPGSLLELAAGLVRDASELHVFAPLPRRTTGVTPSTGYEDVHLVALARLLVPVDHIQVDWQRYGPKLAQVALAFGADDVDDVSARSEVGEGRRRSPLEEIRRNIQAAAGEPIERRALFDGLR